MQDRLMQLIRNVIRNITGDALMELPFEATRVRLIPSDVDHVVFNYRGSESQTMLERRELSTEQWNHLIRLLRTATMLPLYVTEGSAETLKLDFDKKGIDITLVPFSVQ